MVISNGYRGKNITYLKASVDKIKLEKFRQLLRHNFTFLNPSILSDVNGRLENELKQVLKEEMVNFRKLLSHFYGYTF